MATRLTVLVILASACLTACPQKYYRASDINLPSGATIINRTIGPQSSDLYGPFDLAPFNVAVFAQFKDRTGWSAVVAHYDSSLGSGDYTLVAADDPLYAEIAQSQDTGDAVRLYTMADSSKFVLVSDITAMMKEDRSPSVSPDQAMYAMAVMEKK